MGLLQLHHKKRFVRRRESSWDRSGGNLDYIALAPGQEHAVPALEGPGILRHLWVTVGGAAPDLYRAVSLMLSFDGASEPQVSAPLADFFLFGHGIITDVDSAPIQVSRQPHITAPPYRGSLNCGLPMPFSREARVAFANRSQSPVMLYYYVDWERHAALEEPVLHFRATLNEELTEPPAGQPPVAHGAFDSALLNPSDRENYVLLHAEGYEGHYVGTALNATFAADAPGKWWEGDDMFVIDGEPWPPRLHGTGTEDYFNLAWGFRKAECRPEYGVTWIDRGEAAGDPLVGRFSAYRFHISDPIPFERSLRATLEHGHANDCRVRYRSIAYWYGRKL